MLIQIARFEFRYLLRNPLLWLTAALTFAMIFFSMNVEGWEMGSEGGLVRNAAYATLRNSLMLSLVFMFVTTSFVANAVIRDDETGYGPIIRSTPITKSDYVFGRFLGAFAVTAVCMLALPLATVLGSLMPWANPANLGPNRITDHLYAYFLIALPNILTHSAIFFALATITRSMMATYLGVISFVAAFFSLEGALSRPQLEAAVAIAEPFAARAVKDAVRYWTIAERNTMLPDFSGALLYNRLVWLGVSILCLAAAYAVYRFADQGMSKRDRRKWRTGNPSSPDAPLNETGRIACPPPRHGNAALRALLWLRMKFEFRQVILSPAFPVLMLYGMYVTVFVLLTQRYPDYAPEYPTTLTLIPEIEDAFRLVLMIVAVYYAGELVWRERDRRVHELIDAAPIPNWTYVVPKTMALALVLVSMLVCNVAASIALQLSLGFTNIELGKYLLWYVLPQSFDMLLVAAVAILVQSLSLHKAIGWAVMVLLLMWRELNNAARYVNHHLLNYGETSAMPLSDLNGAAGFWKGAWTFRLYWGAFAALLLLAAHLLWRRGTEIRLKPRLALARRRLAGTPGLVGAAALLIFAATGAYAFYNTNILNEYRTLDGSEAWSVEYEKRFAKYAGLPQPSLEELTLDIAIYPEERRAMTRGRYLLRNTTAQPIPDLHVRLVEEGVELTSVNIAGAQQILNDKTHNYRIYRLARPMQPGDALHLSFETRRWHRGFRNGAQQTTIVENGTFLTETDLMPILGMNNGALIHDPEVRRRHGLAELAGPPKLEDLSATTRMSFANGWIRKSDITVSTDAGQTPIAPGTKVSDVTRDGRRSVRFVSTAPTRPRFSVQSARYAEKHRRHRGVDFAVYYHPEHAWNVDRMLDAMAASLDYYQANFGPYQFDHFRIVEFPAYHGYAQAFAGTIPFSEAVGFIGEYKEEDETIDFVTGITAHEFAHQWWPHQMMGAETEGYTLFVETLAQYSAHMVMKQLRGEDQIRRYLQFELDRYLQGRPWDPEEPPLARVIGQDHVAYRKGAMVMHLLTKRLGEDGVNRALRNMLARYKFKGAPYPRSLDLIAALRAEAKTAEDQALITDLFERVTLYDLKVAGPTAARRADGKWDVIVPIEAKKMYADGKGAETEPPLAERIEVGLFTSEPGRNAFDQSHVLLMERQPIRSGRQVLKFVTEKRPLYAGVDPYNFYIDRDSGDNVSGIAAP
jgi:ABC-2 type transport system permease protein